SRAQLHVCSLPELPGSDDSLRLMTVRSEGQFNTVVYEEEDLYRGQDRRDVILLHPDDIQRMGLQVDGRVAVHGEAGTLDNILVRSFPAIRAGNALMYYPEANVLISRRTDPSSKTPAFKGTIIRIEAAAGSRLCVPSG
ncbi:MAG TPA: molybdopterin dinucleotide binding domain-containing protein, partial [Pirellulales bacterium]|nr:molybdopterin dinucleotide binding domain-containing protein [Pirellulales bacterium]